MDIIFNSDFYKICQEAFPMVWDLLNPFLIVFKSIALKYV